MSQLAERAAVHIACVIGSVDRDETELQFDHVVKVCDTPLIGGDSPPPSERERLRPTRYGFSCSAAIEITSRCGFCDDQRSRQALDEYRKFPGMATLNSY